MEKKKKKKKNLTFNVTIIYSALAFSFFIGIIFFGTSKLFFAEDFPINQTPLNEELDLRSNGKMEIISWIYDTEKEKMEIVLATNGMRNYKSDLSFSAVTRNEPNKDLPLEIAYDDNDIFVIEIDNVKKNFNQLALRLHKNDRKLNESFDEDFIQNDKDKKTFSTIYTDERKVKKEELKEKDTLEYVVEITQNLIKNTENEIKNKKDEIKRNELIITTIEDEIRRLEEDILYQTVDEQIDTSNKIDKIKKEIEEFNKEIENNKIDIKNLELKINKLKQRILDTELQ